MSNRYTFPHPPVGDGEIIDLTEDEKPFYFNPYSGELSLDFPRATRNCRGGILAYALLIPVSDVLADLANRDGDLYIRYPLYYR